jgi:hypothetical protein
MADTADAILTALALIEARLDGRDSDLRFLLDGADLRPACAVLVPMLASCLCGASSATTRGRRLRSSARRC